MLRPAFDHGIEKTDVDGKIGGAISSQTANREGKRLMPLGGELTRACGGLLLVRAPSRVRPRDRKRSRVGSNRGYFLVSHFLPNGGSRSGEAGTDGRGIPRSKNCTGWRPRPSLRSTGRWEKPTSMAKSVQRFSPKPQIARERG